MVSGWEHSNVVIIFTIQQYYWHILYTTMKSVLLTFAMSTFCTVPWIRSRPFVLHGHQKAKSLGDDDSKEQETCADSHAFYIGWSVFSRNRRKPAPNRGEIIFCSRVRSSRRSLDIVDVDNANNRCLRNMNKTSTNMAIIDNHISIKYNKVQKQ